MRQSRVSLCMIVRDEEDNLDRCLSAAKPYVDEICIVDTGSTDATISIAKSHGARIEEIAWPDDFAEARNHSLAMATGDWVLVLDADEVLRPDSLEEFSRVVDDENAIAGFQNIVNHGDDGKKVSCLIMRLFRRMPEHIFTGAIHEQVITPILDNGQKLGMRVVDSVLDIDHYGYTEAVRQDKKKDARNRLHFEKALEKNPHDAYVWFKYGDFLRRFEDMGPVLHALEQSVLNVAAMSDAEVHALTYPAEPHALLALELIKLGRLKEAQGHLEVARSRMRVTPMLHWVWGHLNLKLENWTEAKKAFEACHELDEKPVHVPAQPGITAGRSVFGIARSLLGMGEKDQAIRLFEEGAARWPTCADLQKATARIRIAQRDFKGAIELCTGYLRTDESDAEFWQIGAEMMMELGLWDQAETWALRAQKVKVPENAGLCHGTSGECYLGKMQIEAAADAWSECAESPGCAGGLILVRLMIAEPIPGAIDLENPAIQHGVNNILRRLRRAPYGEDVLNLIRAGLSQRPLPNSSMNQLLMNQLAAPLVSAP